jgi:hypothetical protein
MVHGSNNTLNGTRAAYHNEGSQNTIMGSESCDDAVSMRDCTGIGFQVLIHTTGATEETACGENTLYSDLTGAKNTALGANALFSNTTGAGNVGLGYGAGNTNTTGNNQLFIANSTTNLPLVEGTFPTAPATPDGAGTVNGTWAARGGFSAGPTPAPGVSRTVTFINPSLTPYIVTITGGIITSVSP